MANHFQIPHRWSLITQAPPGECGLLDAAHLVTPRVPGSSLTPLLSGLMPNRNHNDDLVQGIGSLPTNGFTSQPMFSVFAADPFIEGKRVAQRLLEKGLNRVVNWPTTAQYGTEFCETLDSVNMGPRQEYENLLRLADRGLSISLAVCTAKAAAEFTRLKPEVVFLAPTFDLWTNGRMRSSELLRRCVALARVVQGKIPIVLMSARGTVTLSHARKAGATGLLIA